ncbi:hypothetical protein [Flammeovirga aprica]|uniref:DUF3352 domain-containing protein n=1 Tax=Flammeovirga aprica JL-4 TaxID=694437 RepID=A0A7X9RV10_9BACT|nr:hypothetical protein [Flammeovirga aprica]NME69225.1 hypothetical protein [Flammeovirga aprica JL-4]
MGNFRLSDTYKLVITQILALSFLLIGFYFIDLTRKKSYETDIWHVVASETIALVEMQQPEDLVTYLDSSAFVRALKDMEGGQKAFETTDQLLTLLDSAIQNPFLGVKKQVYLSVNATGSQSFSLSVYIPMDERIYLDPFTQLTSLQNETYIRKYKGEDIHEYRVGNDLLSVAKIRNFLVASTDALWIEEAIRNNGERFNEEYYFGLLNQDLANQINDIKLPDGLKVWIRPSSVEHWFARMTDLGTENPFKTIAEFSNGMLVKSIQEKENELSILSSNRNQSSSYYKTIETTLHNGKTEAYSFMVDDISFYEQCYASDFSGFVKLAFQYDEDHDIPTSKEIVKQFEQKGLEVSDLMEQVKSDVFKATILSVDGSQWQNIFGFELKDPVEFDVVLDNLRKDYEEESEQKVKLIGLKGFTIYGFPKGNLSGALAGSNYFDNHENSYVLRVNNYMIMAGDLPTLSKWLKDWLLKRRWTTQKRYNDLINKLQNNEAKLSYVLNTESSWVGFMHALSKSHAAFMDRHRQLLLGLNFQVWSLADDKIEVSALFSGQIGDDQPKKVKKILTKAMDVALSKAPIVVDNVLGDEEGFLLIDEENIVEGYNFDGDTIFYHEFDSVIKATPELVWSINSDIPSLFLTQNNQILQIDRSGKYLEGYPVNLPIYSQIEYTKWLPWHLRGSTELIQDIEGLILSVDTLGNIYGVDPKGNYQGNWTPQKTLERLALTPQVFQANGKNYVVTLSKNGKLIIFTEKGEYAKGFPMLFRESVSPQLFVTEDASLGQSKISFITSIGDIIEVNGKGQVLRRERLGDRAHGRSFDLLKDEARGRTWMVMEQIYGDIKVRNSSGKVVFHQRFDEKGKAIGQYFDFGIDAELICITFPNSGKTYLYYLNGKRFVEKPFNNDREVKMFYDSDIQQFIFITSLKNKVSLYTIDRRN